MFGTQSKNNNNLDMVNLCERLQRCDNIQKWMEREKKWITSLKKGCDIYDAQKITCAKKLLYTMKLFSLIVAC